MKSRFKNRQKKDVAEKRQLKRMTATIFTIMILLVSLVVTGVGEHYAWDCTVCGRTGNTGNFCGYCSQPAPWMTYDPVSTSISTITVTSTPTEIPRETQPPKEELIPVLSEIYPGIQSKFKQTEGRWYSKYGPGEQYASGSGGYKTDSQHSSKLTLYYCEDNWIFAYITYSTASSKYAYLPRNSVADAAKVPIVDELEYVTGIIKRTTVPFLDIEGTYNPDEKVIAKKGVAVKVFFREGDYIFAEYECDLGLIRTWLPIDSVNYD